MNLNQLKECAESFRAVAEDKAALAEFAKQCRAAHVGDKEMEELCDRFLAAKDGDEVRRVSDDVSAAEAKSSASRIPEPEAKHMYGEPVQKPKHKAKE